MIVCHCHAVTDRDIRAAARQGAASCDDVKRVCQAGGDCGNCHARVQMIVQGERSARTEKAPAVAS